MMLDEAKNLHIVFKLNLNKISKGKLKPEEQKSSLKKLLCKSREAVIKVFNNNLRVINHQILTLKTL